MKSLWTALPALVLLAAGAAHAQAYTATTGTTTYSSIYSLSGATKLWDAYADYGSSGSTTARNLEKSITLPFAFNFYGSAYTTAVVSTSGYLSFAGTGSGNCTSCYSNAVLGSSAATPNNLIAAFWDDWAMLRQPSYYTSYADAKIYTYVTGTTPNRVFTVEWYRMGTPNTSGSQWHSASAMVQLYESNSRIRFIYGPGYYTPSYAVSYNYGYQSWSAGVEGPTGLTGQSVTFPSGLCANAASCIYSAEGGSPSVNGYYSELVPANDESVTRVAGPAAIRTGDTITVEKTVANLTSSAQGARGYKIYLSSDATISASDNEIYSGFIPAIAASGSNSDPVSFQLDYAGAASSYYFGVILAAGDAVGANDVLAGNQTTLTVPLAILSTSPRPDAVEGVFYSDTLVSVGPGTSRTWSISGGALPAGLSLDTATGTISGTPSSNGAASFEVTVGNGTDTASRTLGLTVRPRLRITTASLPDAVLNAAYSQTLAAEGGPDGRTWSITFGSLPTGLTLSSSTGVISGTSTSSTTASFTVRAQAGAQSDSRSLEIKTFAALTVTLSGAATNPPDAITGVAYSVTPTIAGGNGTLACSITSGTLPTGLGLTGSSGCSLTGTVNTTGTWTFNYQVVSGNQTVIKSWTINAVATLVIDTASLPDGVEGTLYSLQLAASGGTTSRNWTRTSGTLPAGLTFNSSGLLAGTPTAGTANAVSLTFQVVSGSQTVSKTLTLFVVGRLRLLAAAFTDAVRGTAYSAQIPYSGGRSTRSFSYTGALPPGLGLGQTTGIISGNATDTGNFAFTVTVTSDGQTDSRAYTLAAYDPLLITSSSIPEGLVGASFTYTLSTSGGAASKSWSSGTLPAGLYLEVGTGRIYGTPSSAANSSVTFTVQSGSQSVSRALTIVVYGVLSISTSALPDAGRSMAYDVNLAATGGTAGKTWSIVSGALPDGLTDTPAGRIHGTLSAGAATSSFVVRVDSGSQADTRPLSITVYPTLSVSTSALPDGYTTRSYSATLSATGGTGASYRWTFLSGAPSGLSIGLTTGTITGTPATAGSYNVVVQVATGTLSATRALALNVIQGLQITTQSLAAPIEDDPYSVTFQATGGGAGGYQWTRSSGTLPPGLALTTAGVLSGTPTQPGTWYFDVQVSSGGQTATRSYAFQVLGRIAIVTDTLPEGIRDYYSDEYLEASGGTGVYSWRKTIGTLPTGLTLSSAGRLSGYPSAAGTFTFTVEATSGSQVITRELVAVITEPLIMSTTLLPDAVRQADYSVTLQASGGTSERRWAITTGFLPPGMALVESGLVSGRPTSLGTSYFQVEVTSGSQTASQSLSISVYDGLVISTTTLPEGIRSRYYTTTLSAQGGGTSRTWSLILGQLPPGLALSSFAGILAGTPSAAGTYNFTVQVDSVTFQATKALTVTIGEPLAISNGTLQGGALRQAYDQTLTASGGLVSDRRWSILTGRLPPALSLGSDGRITGTPVVEGEYLFEAQLQSGSQTVTRVFTIDVTDPEPLLRIATTRLPPAFVGQGYQATVEATGGIPPYKWSGSSLPDGVTLAAETGVLSGTPTRKATFGASITVTDSAEKKAVTRLDILVADPAEVTPIGGILPRGLVFVGYSTTLVAVGGAPPYSWRVIENLPPGGLVLETSGNLSGVPSEIGLREFTVEAADTAGKKGTAKYLLAVGEPGRVDIATDVLPDGRAGAPYRADLIAMGGTEPYVFSVTSGLPDGLAVDTQGILSGKTNAAGAFAFTVRVDDSAGRFATRDLSVIIAGIEERAEVEGCGCGNAGGAGNGAVFGLLAIGMALLRRRRA